MQIFLDLKMRFYPPILCYSVIIFGFCHLKYVHTISSPYIYRKYNALNIFGNRNEQAGNYPYIHGNKHFRNEPELE